MWKDIATAPLGYELELAVIDSYAHPLLFPCRRTERGWINAVTGQSIDVTATHWRCWPIMAFFCCCG